MSTANGRGPLIQRQGFVKRAPSGKLSAFKKWEKKWCVFAISKRSGPVLDFFEDRMSMDSGPAAALGRVELRTTKQVCAAIQCKVPYTFIIVTESKIVSLAALSQNKAVYSVVERKRHQQREIRSEAESWISCLRRVLTAEGCLQSSEEHEYEISAAGITRQEQERLARARRRPPTPPDSSSEDGSRELLNAPPILPSHNRANRLSPSTPPGLAPTLPPVVPKRGGAGKEPLPPPVPTSNRPSRQTENDFAPQRDSQVLRGEDAVRNLQAVLQNYDESADTTYQSGDRAAISAASHTLNHRLLTASLLQEQQRAEALESTFKSSTLTNGAVSLSSAPIYSKINKQNRPAVAAGLLKPPVAARRVHTLKRIEHDFSPSLSSTGQDDSRAEARTEVRLEVSSDSDDSDDFVHSAEYDEGTYTCMDGFADSVIGRVAVGRRDDCDDDDDDDRYVVSPVKPNIPTDVESIERPRVKPRTPDVATVLSTLIAPQPDEEADNIYENSKTVKGQGKPKAMPVAVPRRAATITGSRVKSARPTQLDTSAPKPQRRESADALFDGEENYENALGLFGIGVTSDKLPRADKSSTTGAVTTPSEGRRPSFQYREVPKSRDTQNTNSSTKTSKLLTAQSASVDLPYVPLPLIPGTNSSSRRLSVDNCPMGMTDGMQTPLVVDIQSAGAQSKPGSADKVLSSSAQLIVDIPLADGESSDSLPSEPSAVSPITLTASNQSNNSSISRSNGDDLRNRLESVPTHNVSLPIDEAPPPYTPPRLLNDTQLNNNMDCITEGNSDDEKEAEHKPVKHMESDINKQNAASPSSGPAAAREQMDLIYDSHPAFKRNITVGPTRETDIDGDIRGTTSCTNEGSKRFSPHTPPGSPPLFAKKQLPPKQFPSSPAAHLRRGTQPPTEDIVIRLEDSFPKMQQRTPSRRRTNYLEEVMYSPHNSSERPSKSSLRKSFSVLSSTQRNYDATSDPRPRVAPRLSASTDALRQPPVAEYDHVIRERVLQANKRLVNSDSSSDVSDTAVIRRKPKATAESRQRRKSAPPNSLSIKAMSELQASSPTPAAEAVPARPTKERRYSRLPLLGGTLLREGKVFKAPQRDGQTNIPLKQAQTELLREEIAHSYGVKVTVWRKDVKYALFVDINNFVWVAGWNQKERPLLQNIFHIGDKIISVNNEPFTSTTKLQKLIKRADSETKFEVVLRRLPFGKAYFVHRNLDYEDIGLEVDATSELVRIVKGSLVSQQGLRINPNKAFGSGQCHWVITEVNHRPLTLVSSESEAPARLSAVGKDVSFVVQPQDFVELLRKALKSTFSWKDYLVS